MANPYDADWYVSMLNKSNKDLDNQITDLRYELEALEKQKREKINTILWLTNQIKIEKESSNGI